MLALSSLYNKCVAVKFNCCTDTTRNLYAEAGLKAHCMPNCNDAMSLHGMISRSIVSYEIRVPGEMQDHESLNLPASPLWHHGLLMQLKPQ